MSSEDEISSDLEQVYPDGTGSPKGIGGIKWEAAKLVEEGKIIMVVARVVADCSRHEASGSSGGSGIEVKKVVGA